MEATEDSDGNAAGTMLPGLEEAKGGQIRREEGRPQAQRVGGDSFRYW